MRPQIGKLTTQYEWLKKNLVSEIPVYKRRLLVDMDTQKICLDIGVHFTMYIQKSKFLKDDLGDYDDTNHFEYE